MGCRMGRAVACLLAFAAAVTGGGAWPAAGQCRLCDTPRTSLGAGGREQPIALEVESSVSFGRLVVDGTGSGSIVIRPDGSSFAQGSVENAGPRAIVGSAVVHGEPGRAVRIDLPRRIVLTSLSGGQIVFDDVASDLPSLPRLDSAGRLSFRFGGRLLVAGDVEGQFRGDLPITADYL